MYYYHNYSTLYKHMVIQPHPPLPDTDTVGHCPSDTPFIYRIKRLNTILKSQYYL